MPKAFLEPSYTKPWQLLDPSWSCSRGQLARLSPENWLNADLEYSMYRRNNSCHASSWKINLSCLFRWTYTSGLVDSVKVEAWSVHRKWPVSPTVSSWPSRVTPGPKTCIVNSFHMLKFQWYFGTT